MIQWYMYEPNYISILNSIFPHIYFHLIICNLLCLYLYKSLKWIIFYSQKRNARGTDTRRRTAVSRSCWGERWKYVSFNLYFIHVCVSNDLGIWCLCRFYSFEFLFTFNIWKNDFFASFTDSGLYFYVAFLMDVAE